jgi:hypothetical protein
MPDKVTLWPPANGPFEGWRVVKLGASYETDATRVPITSITVSAVERPVPDPTGVLHDTEVVEIHIDVAQTVCPTDTVAEKFCKPKFDPRIVTSLAPVVAKFGRCKPEINGPSYEKLLASVPTCAPTVTLVKRFKPAPGATTQLTAVSLIHAEVWQTVEPISTVNVGSKAPKFVPSIVIIVIPEGAPFLALANVSTGAP